MNAALNVIAVLVLAAALWHLVPELWARRRPEQLLDCPACPWSIRFRNTAPETVNFLHTLADQHRASHTDDPTDAHMGESWIWEHGDRDTNGDAR
ncbi:hypothetical protein ACIQZO_22470 [Streptomyces sp. NPDC097617]|uniref:hypothetical protein n=1 Tax=Streptomyces sp. NPDC097617 TaxID=3366091 RepID=UPI00380CD09F